MKFEELGLSKRHDTWSNENDFLNPNDEEAAFFQEEFGFSRADLRRIVQTATEIENELKPNDALQNLTYEVADKAWRMEFMRNVSEGANWSILIYQQRAR